MALFFPAGVGIAKGFMAAASNQRVRAQFHAFVKQRRVQTATQVQNLAARRAVHGANLLSLFAVSGGSFGSGTLADQETAAIAQATREQFSLEQSEAGDISGQATTANAQLKSVGGEAVGGFLAAGGAEEIGKMQEAAEAAKQAEAAQRVVTQSLIPPVQTLDTVGTPFGVQPVSSTGQRISL